MSDEKINVGTIALAIFIVLTFGILLFSVDVGLLFEINQHPEYFVVSETIGVSMYPEVYTGDVYVIELCNSSDFTVKTGNILIFYQDDIVVGHRVTSITNDYYMTKGDFNTVSEKVYPEQVIGKVVKIIDRYNPIGQRVTAWVAE